MIRLDLVIGDRLLKPGRDFLFEGRRGDFLDFRDPRDAERLTLTDAGLAELIASDGARLLRADQAVRSKERKDGRLADFGALSADERAKARTRLAYAKAAAALPRPVCDVTLRAVITEVSVELGDESPPSPRHVRRLVERGGERPVASMYAARTTQQGNRTDRLDPRVRAIVDRRIQTDFMRREEPSMSSVLDLVCADIGELNKTSKLALDCPKLPTLQRAIKALPPYDVMAARKGKAAANQKYRGVQTRRDPVRPLELVELDHTPNDLFVICEETALPMGRCTIVGAIDRASRYPLGAHVGFDPPSVHTLMQCMRNGMLPKTYVDRKRESGEWPIKNSWNAFGRWKELSLDRALENIGGDLDDFADEVGFGYRIQAGRDPRGKGCIERFLKTLNVQKLQEQRGTTKSNVIQLGDYDPAKNAVITHSELLYVVHRELLDVYACDWHRGLRGVPAKVWAELTDAYPVDPIEDVQHLNMLIGHVGCAKLTREGIRMEHLQYYSEELVALRRDPAFERACPDGFVRFRFDAGDVGEIRVHDPLGNRLIRVPPCERDLDYATGLSIWQHRKIIEHMNARRKTEPDYDCKFRAKADIAEFFEKAFLRRGRIRHRRTAARHQGVGRHAMAGADEATSPVGSIDRARRDAAVPGSPNAGGRVANGNAPPASRPKSAPVPPLLDGEEEDLYAARGITR